MPLTVDEGNGPRELDFEGTEDASSEALPTEEALDSEGRRIEKFCPKCYLFRTPKEHYCIVCGTKLKEIKLKPKKK